jgi:hypothetical protein
VSQLESRIRFGQVDHQPTAESVRIYPRNWTLKDDEELVSYDQKGSTLAEEAVGGEEPWSTGRKTREGLEMAALRRKETRGKNFSITGLPNRTRVSVPIWQLYKKN